METVFGSENRLSCAWLAVISVEKYFLHIVGQMALYVTLEKQEREPQVTFLMGGLLLDVRFSFLSKQIGISQKTILFLFYLRTER